MTTPATCSAPRVTNKYSTFNWTAATTLRYATPISSPLRLTTTYAPAFATASTLLPSNVTTTSYSLNRNAVTVQDGTYGQGAYARLWESISYNTTIPFTTTMSPTPVASSELVFPPALYTPCPSSAGSCLDCYKFPADFIWGVAGSAFQIEGGLTFAGRGPSDVDTYGALPNIADFANAEVSDMAYFLYKQDIARLAAIGVPYYSFSISWTRILPFGNTSTPVNEPGLAHYDDVINTCIAYGVTPIVTLQHNDFPLSLNIGAPEYPDAFLNYAKQVMTHYGDRVKYWVTLNEPNLAIGLPYGSAGYDAVTNVLMAHAKVYHWYKEVLKGTGFVTLKFANNLALPLDSTNPADIRAAQRYQDYILGMMANPIFLGAQYPEEMLNTTNLNLTALTSEQMGYINGTADFWSFDPYTAQYATSAPGGIDACAADPTNPYYPICVINTNVQKDGWLMGQASYAYAYLAPQYVRQQLGYVWNTFRPSGILIAEFGFNPWAEYTKPVVDQLYDLERTLYYQGFLRETLKAMYEDGVNVLGTLAWSVLDNDEFVSYTQQYGMQHVNRTDGEFTRSFKRSIFDYVDFFHQYVAS
ncbi:hypothetical protein LTR62_004775 [Meristemomyces frigidus]|uniref:Beta-glucosidase n=1 Tax=Meristemomyces frigidus TaxID=1508187 RepID=A0AAN7YFT2_9PEZI|nr:hypothetical protein LTR62_004775 [Meristemomyces frigidus]